MHANNISSFLQTYGVEAARGALIKEISTVFGAYGITVDRRHLSLIGDNAVYFYQSF